MTLRDYVGYSVSGATAEGLAAFEQASGELRCFIGDPLARVERAIAAAPAMTMAHVLRAWLHLLGTEPQGLVAARASLNAAERLSANSRERAHMQAIAWLLDGHFRRAGRTLEDLSIEYPLDTLALQAGHQIDFFSGDSRMLRDRIARALPAFDRAVPGYHALLGMLAFGFEECGEYGRAERYGKQCVELEPRDGWGWHAVAHVLEMQGRTSEGIQWLTGGTSSWAHESFFAVHNWWHLALFHLGRGEMAEALRLYDGPIRGGRSQVVLDMIDGAALLWRLSLMGADVGDRWQSLADDWALVAGAGNYAFNDWHAMMAFVASEREHGQAAVLESLRSVASLPSDAGVFAREVALELAQGFRAFGRGDYAAAARSLRSVRNHAQRFGGSHAQRDIIDLTLIAAAERAGQGALAAALINERANARPNSSHPRWTRDDVHRHEAPVSASAAGAKATGLRVEPQL